jgi:hypothetical protein
MDPVTIALCVTVPVLAGFLAAFAFRKDTEKENRRRAAIVGSQITRDFGLTHAPKILEAYAVGDYSGMVHEVKELAKLATTPALLQAELDSVLKSVVAKKMATPEGKADMQKLVA